MALRASSVVEPGPYWPRSSSPQPRRDWFAPTDASKAPQRRAIRSPTDHGRIGLPAQARQPGGGFPDGRSGRSFESPELPPARLSKATKGGVVTFLSPHGNIGRGSRVRVFDAIRFDGREAVHISRSRGQECALQCSDSHDWSGRSSPDGSRLTLLKLSQCTQAERCPYRGSWCPQSGSNLWGLHGKSITRKFGCT